MPSCDRHQAMMPVVSVGSPVVETGASSEVGCDAMGAFSGMAWGDASSVGVVSSSVVLFVVEGAASVDSLVAATPVFSSARAAARMSATLIFDRSGVFFAVAVLGEASADATGGSPLASLFLTPPRAAARMAEVLVAGDAFGSPFFTRAAANI